MRKGSRRNKDGKKPGKRKKKIINGGKQTTAARYTKINMSRSCVVTISTRTEKQNRQQVRCMVILPPG
jgi:hypothetical protein